MIKDTDVKTLKRAGKMSKKRENYPYTVAQTACLSEQQMSLLMEIMQVGSEKNPFHGIEVQKRNHLMFLMLAKLGIRAEDLLNVKIDEIYYEKMNYRSQYLKSGPDALFRPASVAFFQILT